jgi:hypothetical protein
VPSTAGADRRPGRPAAARPGPKAASEADCATCCRAARGVISAILSPGSQRAAVDRDAGRARRHAEARRGVAAVRCIGGQGAICLFTDRRSSPSGNCA